MPNYICGRAANPLIIDGDIEKPAWRSAPWSEDFVDIEGESKPAPRLRTRFKLLWDDENLYVAAEMEEPQVWGTLTERDSVIFHDNDFELFLDPDGDNQNYVELEINALGTVWDLLMTKPYRDGGMPMSGWQFKGLQSAVKVNGGLNNPGVPSENWWAEIALPWRSMKEVCQTTCPPREGDLWRANFARVEWEVDVADGRFRKVAERHEDNWCWSPQMAVDLHRPECWGTVQFAHSADAEPVADPSAMAREKLHRIYYAQREFRNREGRWAYSLAELGVNEQIEMYATPNYFEAAYFDSGGHWRIASDSYFWQGESYESKCVRGECEFRPDFGAPNVDY